MLRLLIAGVLALVLPVAAQASAVIESLTGTADIGGTPAVKGQRISPQSTITTGAGAQVFLRFDDGMQIMLGAESMLRLVDFRFGGGQDRAVLELQQGSARVVTGAVARDNPKQFWFRMPQAELMVERPSDFTVALVNPAYITVSQGGLVVNNAAGTAALKAGTTSVVANAGAAPVAISAAQLPASASAGMSGLGTASASAAGGQSSGAGAVAGGASTTAAWVPVAIFAGVAAAAAAVAAKEENNSTPTAATHH